MDDDQSQQRRDEHDRQASQDRVVDSKVSIPGPLLREQQLAAVGQLTADFAHNLNNLVTSILGNLALARSAFERGERGETIDVAFDGIHQAARTAGDASRALLTFARGSEGDWRPIDLATLTERAMSLLRLPHGIRLETAAAPKEPVFVQGDPALLELAMVNLVLLARHMLTRGGKLGVSVQADPAATDAQAATARVLHTVSGHAASRIARLLEVEDAGTASTESGGLELLVARSIASQHGGHVELVSRGDAEVQIELRLPRLAIEDRLARFSVPDASPAVGQGRSVLLVEAQRHIGELVASALRHVGFEVEMVRSPAEASSKLVAGDDPDAMVLDLAGSDAHWILEARSQYPLLPIIVIDRDLEPGAFAGEVESIAVPFRMFELADAVDRGISRHRPEA